MEEDKDGCNTGTTKRKLFEGSSQGDDEKAAKRPRLQVKIPKLKISNEQLENLRKRLATRRKNDVATVTVNTSAAVSSVPPANPVTATPTVTEQKKAVEESPVRHRLTNLLDGTSVSSYLVSAEQPDVEEGNVESVDCTGGDKLNDGKSLSGQVLAEDKSLFSEELLPFNDVCSPLPQEEDCITVVCYPEVVSKTCMQTSETAKDTPSADNESTAAGAMTASGQDKEEECAERQTSQPSNDDVLTNLAEDGSIPGSATCDNSAAVEQLVDDAVPITESVIPDNSAAVEQLADDALPLSQSAIPDHSTAVEQLGDDALPTTGSANPENCAAEEKLANDALPIPESVTPDNCGASKQLAGEALPENKEDEKKNAEESSSGMSEPAEDKVDTMDYASNYNTLEMLNTLLASLTEEKRARAELEEVVSQLENKNQELVSECVKLKDLVNDLLPSKVKNETVSRGVQINMDLSMRRGRAVDRATSPLLVRREPSPDLSLLSFSIGCQTVNVPKETVSTSCQTDPLVHQRLSAQTSAPARVQGIVMPNIQGRAQVSQASNPVQVANSWSHPSYAKPGSQVEAAQQFNMQSQRGQTELIQKHPMSVQHNTPQYPTNMLQTAGYNNATAYQSGTLNRSQVRASQLPVSTTGQYARGPNQFVQITSPVTIGMSGNHTLAGTNPNAYSGLHNVANQRNALSSQQANTQTLSQLLTQNESLAQQNVLLSERNLSSAQSILYNSRPSQHVAMPQHSNHHQATPVTSQVSAHDRSAIIQHKTNTLYQLLNERRRQIAEAQSLYHNPISGTSTRSTAHNQVASRQPTEAPPPYPISGTSLPSMAHSQVARQQNTEAPPPLQHRLPPSHLSQVAQQHAQPNPVTLRNSSQPLGTFSSSSVVYNQVTVNQHIGLRERLTQSQTSQVTQRHTQPNPASLRHSPQTSAFTSSRVAYSQVTTQQPSPANRLQHRVSPPGMSQARVSSQPSATSTQQTNSSNMAIHKSGQNPSSTQTTNSSDNIIRSLLHNALGQSSRSQGEAQSLYNEVQLVYNELQKSLDETTSHDKQKQGSSAQAARPSDNQQNQLQASSNAPSNELTQETLHCSRPASSLSDQSPAHRPTPESQFQLEDIKQESASETAMEMPQPNRSTVEARDKRSVHFSVDSLLGESSGNEKGFSHLDSSNCTDQNSVEQQESHHVYTDKDPYKAPPKTPSGALDDTVKRLLALANEMSGTEEADNKCEPSDDITETTEDSSQMASTLETPQSEQELDTNGDNNQSNTTQDSSVSRTGSDADLNNEPEVDVTSVVLEDNKKENEIEEEPDNAVSDGQENRVSEEPESPTPRSPFRSPEARDKDSDENDNSFPDIYMDLMSPIIPRMPVSRRFRLHSPTEDAGDADASTSSSDVSNKKIDNEECDPEPTSATEETEENLSQCRAEPSDNAHPKQQENGRDIEGRQQDDVVDGQDVQMENERDIEGSQLQDIVDDPMSSEGTTLGVVDYATEQDMCNTVPEEVSGTHPREEQLAEERSDEDFNETTEHLSEEHLGAETSNGNPTAEMPVPSSHVKLEASFGQCMNEVAHKDTKMVVKKEQFEPCVLNPKAIPRQEFFQQTAIVSDLKVAENPPLRLEHNIPSSLVKKSSEESSRILVDSNMNVEHNKTDTAASNRPLQQPSNTVAFPMPRLALRVVNGNTVIMWDLPPDNNITGINFFEVYVYLVNKDSRRTQNRNGQWIKIGEMKAMPLPMACTIRHLIQKKVVYFFIVRAIGHSGAPGQFSKPCCVACK